MVLGLAAMPLCALVAVVLLTFQKYHSDAVNTLAVNQGLVVLPFVLLTSIVLLFAVLILADHQRLERANQLSGLREIYYQGLRQQESQVPSFAMTCAIIAPSSRACWKKAIPRAPLATWSKWLALRPCRAGGDFAHFAAIATGPLLLSGYSGQRVADNFRNREYYPLLKKLKMKKSPLIPPGTPMPPELSKRAYLPKCFKQSWAIPTTPQRLIFTTILTQNPSFMRWILLRLLTSYYQIQKIKTTKKPCNH